jgi:hypothetical protein
MLKSQGSKRQKLKGIFQKPNENSGRQFCEFFGIWRLGV